MSSDLDIMLIGKTGVGKSKTGNSILDRNAFMSVPSMDSATIKSQKEITVLEDGRKLCVVDTPGVGDTRMSLEKGQKLFMTAIREAILFNPAGYHALILVLRFGSRFSEEDNNVLKYLKIVFGQDFVQKHCILLMTHGDNFDNARKEGEITVSFLEWCKQQTGLFKNLLAEVQERIVLFNNRGSPQQKIDQRRQLVSMVDQLQVIGGGRYIDSNFEEARKLQEKLVSENKISQLAVETQQELSVILFEKVKVRSRNEDVDAQITALEGLKANVEELLKRVQEAPNHTKDLTNVQALLSETRQQIEVEISELQMARNVQEKETTSAGEKDEEMLRMQSELASLRAQNKTLNAKLDQHYQETRDANNKSWASTIWEVVVSVAKSPFVQEFVTDVIIPKVKEYFKRR